MKKVIALLGQPNAGKSTVFNGLTGAHQHVGNWPGKTVEHKEGKFTYEGDEYDVIDLPGSYSLAAGSDEEVITSNYIQSGVANLIAILVDSPQLERSLYMYTDFIGLNIPAVLILNLMDVAEDKGIQIDVEKLSNRLGIPVIGFVASDLKRYGELKKTLVNAISVGKIADQSKLTEYYRNDTDLSFDELVSKQPEKKLYTKESSADLLPMPP